MRNIFNLVLFLGFFIGNSYCQDSLNYKAKWQTRPNFGVNIPITKLLDGRIPGNLFEYGDNSIYWQVLTVSYFFHRHWGVDFNFQGMTSKNITKRADIFSEAMRLEYQGNYYVTPSTGASYNFINPFGGNFGRGFISLIYRYEKKRLFIYPKFSIGVNSIYIDWGEALLKQKNSNKLLKVSYESDIRPKDNFIMATSASFGYKLSKRFYFNLELMTSYYKTHITLTKKITDLNTTISTNEDIEYNKDIFTISIGGGLIFVIK